MVDELLLISGNDIPFLQGEVIIHQPSLKEIAYITEKTFWIAYETLKFDKDTLSVSEAESLANYSNFQLIFALLTEKRSIESQKTKNNVLSLFSILFPTNKIILSDGKIILINEKTNENGEINNNNFDIFLKILKDMFCLNQENKQYDPSGALAKKIADQIKRGQKKKAQLGPKQDKVSFFSRYISIIAAAKNKSINEIMDYTIYQLMDEFNRFMLYKANEQWLQLKIAGATGLKDPEDWLKDIHSQNNNFNKEETLI